MNEMKAIGRTEKSNLKLQTKKKFEFCHGSFVKIALKYEFTGLSHAFNPAATFLILLRLSQR